MARSKENGSDREPRIPRTPITRPAPVKSFNLVPSIPKPISNPSPVLSPQSRSPKFVDLTPKFIPKTPSKTAKEKAWIRKERLAGSEDADTVKKLARIAAIKEATLNDKNYNVKTSTEPDGSPATSDLLGTGGGGSYYGDYASQGTAASFLSSIPTLVWIIIAVGVGGFFLLKGFKKGK